MFTSPCGKKKMQVGNLESQVPLKLCWKKEKEKLTIVTIQGKALATSALYLKVSSPFEVSRRCG